MKFVKMFFPWVFAWSAIVLAPNLTGCKSPGDDGMTPTGIPEVTIRAATTDQVKVAVQDFFLKRGYTETQSSHAYEVTFDKAIQGGRGSKALRVRLRLHKLADDSWKLIGTPLGVEGWRSNLEAEQYLPQGASQIQGFLVEIKRRIESGKRSQP